MKRSILVLLALSLATLTGCATLKVNALQEAHASPSRPRAWRTPRSPTPPWTSSTRWTTPTALRPVARQGGLRLLRRGQAGGGRLAEEGPERSRPTASNETRLPRQREVRGHRPVVETFLNKDVGRLQGAGQRWASQTPLGVLTFPLEKEGTFPVPKIPQRPVPAPAHHQPHAERRHGGVPPRPSPTATASPCPSPASPETSRWRAPTWATSPRATSACWMAAGPGR